jgi:putative ABC transport system permease protein
MRRCSESTVLVEGTPLRVGVTPVSEGFFDALAVTPRTGRAFRGDEHRLGATPVVVVSDAFWRNWLGAAPDLSARLVSVAGVDAQVVGVMPPGFDFPGRTDVWYPMEIREQTLSRTAHNWTVFGRLRSGIDLATADREMDAITDAFMAEEPGAATEDWFADFFPRSARVVPLQQDIVGDTAKPLWMLLGASVLVLLVACVNLASATLARGTARDREYAVRRSLGASRGVLLGQLLTESVVLSVGGCILALGLAAAAIRALPSLAPAGIPRIDEVTLGGTVAVVAMLVSLLTAALFGLLPALRATEASHAGALRGGSRGGNDRGKHRTWKALIATEVALALILLVGSGLLIRSFRTVLSVEPGFRTDGLLTATVNPPAGRYGTTESRGTYYDALLRELQAAPGVARVGLISSPPLSFASNGRVGIRGAQAAGANGDYQLVGGDYFEVLGIPLLAGRLFDERDRAGAQHVVIVNRAFAEIAWPGEDALGRQMTGGGMDDFWDQDTWATVVGIVGDSRQRDLTRPAEPTYYFPLAQRPFRSWSMTAILAPAGGSASNLSNVVRESVRRVDSEVPVALATIENRLSRALTPRRFTVMVLGVFAAVALTLACIGIWGVVSYAVARRTREIGIRMALGADAPSVRRLLQLDYLRPAMLGAIAGLLGALALTRLLQSMLYETAPTDPATFLIVIAVLGAAAWLASFVPSLRATRISPMETMRAE